VRLLGGVDQQEEEGECARGDGALVHRELFDFREEIVEIVATSVAVASRSRRGAETLYCLVSLRALEPLYHPAEGGREPPHVFVERNVFRSRDRRTGPWELN
jgi:hypothetical protein